jgi:SAM-dependent methyltransferase
MDHIELSHIVNNIAHRYMDSQTPGYFDCLEALDALEFNVLDFMDQGTASHEMGIVREQAIVLHSQLASIAQTTIDKLIQDIRSHQLSAPALKQLFNQYADSVSDKLPGDQPDFDLFDDFLSHLLQADYEPSETRCRTEEMYYLQPTPGRIILDMINELPFTDADCFYDLGSGLGCVPILVSLLTDTNAVGIEYEPTYTHYARCSAQKLGMATVEFRNLDVLDADFSDGTIFFMYTPFTGSILRNVLNRLRDLSKQRRITLCTYGPCTPLIEHETWLYPIRGSEGKIYRLAIFSAG